jgi:hypothetical protein
MKRRAVLGLAIAIVLASSARQASANITINGPANANHVNRVANGDDWSQLMPDPVTYLRTATQNMKNALAADFPAWTFIYRAPLNGTLNINQYKAVLPQDEVGGGRLEATYTRANTDPAIADLHWIQMIDTNVPLGGNTNFYIDPRPNDDTLPFYWTLAEDNNANDGNKTANTYHFFDQSKRDLSSDTLKTWRGELMLASWDGNDPGTVYVYDGIRWGWNAKSTDTPPAPEPSSLALLVIGGVGSAFVTVRRRRRQLP